MPGDGAFAYGSFPDLDELYRLQADESDVAKRQAMLHKLQMTLHERRRFVPIYDYIWASGVGPRVYDDTELMLTLDSESVGLGERVPLSAVDHVSLSRMRRTDHHLWSEYTKIVHYEGRNVQRYYECDQARAALRTHALRVYGRYNMLTRSMERYNRGRKVETFIGKWHY